MSTYFKTLYMFFYRYQISDTQQYYRKTQHNLFIYHFMKMIFCWIFSFSYLQLTFTNGHLYNPKGPTFRNLSILCLENIVRDHFHSTNTDGNATYSLLLTIMVSPNLSSPAYEIQEGKVIYYLIN